MAAHVDGACSIDQGFLERGNRMCDLVNGQLVALDHGLELVHIARDGFERINGQFVGRGYFTGGAIEPPAGSLRLASRPSQNLARFGRGDHILGS